MTQVSIVREALESYEARRLSGDFDEDLGEIEKVAGGVLSGVKAGVGRWWARGAAHRAAIGAERQAGKLSRAKQNIKYGEELHKTKLEGALGRVKDVNKRKAELAAEKHTGKLERARSGESWVGGIFRRRAEAKEAARVAAEAAANKGKWKVPAVIGGAAALGGLAYAATRNPQPAYVPSNY